MAVKTHKNHLKRLAATTLQQQVRSGAGCVPREHFQRHKKCNGIRLYSTEVPGSLTRCNFVCACGRVLHGAFEQPRGQRGSNSRLVVLRANKHKDAAGGHVIAGQRRTRLNMDRPLATVFGRFKKDVGAVAGRSLSSDDAEASMRGDSARFMPAWSNSELLQNKKGVGGAYMSTSQRKQRPMGCDVTFWGRRAGRTSCSAVPPFWRACAARQCRPLRPHR